MDKSYRHRTIDVVFCVDASENMKPIWADLPAQIESFCHDFIADIANRFTEDLLFRPRFVIFRDDPNEMEETSFAFWGFDERYFFEKLGAINASGGNRENSCGFDALRCAYESNFLPDPISIQLIVLITKNDAMEGKKPAFAKLPRSRLIVLAPEGSRYEELASEIPGAILHPVAHDQERLGFDAAALLCPMFGD